MTTPGRAFLRGLLAPSLASLVGAVLVAVSLGGAALFLGTPARVAAFGTACGWDRLADAPMSFTIRCLTLANDPPPPGAVVLIGASDLETGILSESELSRGIESEIGVRPSVFDLAFPGVDQWYAIAALDHLPAGFEGVVVLAVSPERLTGSPGRLADDYRNHRAGVTSDLLDDEARREGVVVPGRSGFHLVDHYPFYRLRVLRLLRLALPGRVAVPAGLEFTPSAWEDEPRRRTESGLESRLSSYGDQAPAALARLGRALTVVRARTRARILLVEMPRRPGWAAGFYGEKLLAEHRAGVLAFAAAHGASYIALADGVELEPGDFADHCHLMGDAARRRLTAALARRIAAVLAEPEEGR